ELFETLSRPDAASALPRMDAEGPGGAAAATRAMRELHRVMRRADVRYSGWLHLPLQLLLLWDAHVVRSPDRWRARYGATARAWFDAAGRAEALCALATLAHDHPEWCYPEIATAGPPRLVASALGHPLIDPAVRVDNDVEVGPPNTFLLVTGSNMS